MTEGKEERTLEDMEALRQRQGVSDAVFAGVKASMGWKNGRKVGEQEFMNACEAFRRASAGGGGGDREAKG